VTPAIEAVDVTKVYRRYARSRQFATLKSALLSRSLIRDLHPDETFPALQGVSFSVPQGTTYGIIGRNGSGKSTMLKCVAGITKPTTGRVTVRGRISALIELGAGFHPEISGRENIFINGIMLGLTKREVARLFDEIVDFAELKDFIDAPVKTYSSGMYMRLGFAVAIHVNPDVLLVDEVLAVGDEGFTHKCLDKFAEFRRRGKTILIVTHSLGLVERFCDEALWIDAGKVRGAGDPRSVVGAYREDVAQAEEATLAAADAKARDAESTPASAGEPLPEDPVTGAESPSNLFLAAQGRWGNRAVEIEDVQLLDAQGRQGHVFRSGEPFAVAMRLRAERPVTDFVFGVAIFNAEGICVYGTNTEIESYVPQRLEAGTVTFAIERLDLVDGTYKLDVAVHKRDSAAYDYHRSLYTFRVQSRVKDVGLYRPAHRWTFDGAIDIVPLETPDGVTE
jgi:ABC-type polysaccharide/polyol phosphate transport system ATPase subunit